ncbi:MAG: DUF4299 family protein [Clostridia bacterium]|nr:DUF4299 family protein [Clostridia bacterium]
MGLDVTIRQKGFRKKTMPLDVILGSELHYGDFFCDHIIKDQLGDFEFIAYHPEHIGRGFSVAWNPAEKKRIDLRLPFPTTPAEFSDFFETVRRISTYWNSTLEVDGNKVALAEFLSELDNMIEFNKKHIQHCANDVLEDDKEDGHLTFMSVMHPLNMGKEEAALFIKDNNAFCNWLHEKQCVDADYDTPRFFFENDEVVGRYSYVNGRPHLFAGKPSVPFGVVDTDTGLAIECDCWKVEVFSDKDTQVAELDYSEFLSRIPTEKVQRHDAHLLLIAPLSDEEFSKLIQS